MNIVERERLAQKRSSLRPELSFSHLVFTWLFKTGDKKLLTLEGQKAEMGT